MHVGAYLLTFSYFSPRSLTTLQDAKIMSIKIHFKGYRSAHLEIQKWLMSTINIIQKILEKNKQTNKQKPNKNKQNVQDTKKKGFVGNFMSKIKQRRAEKSLFKNCEFLRFQGEIPICAGLCLSRVLNSRSES